MAPPPCRIQDARIQPRVVLALLGAEVPLNQGVEIGEQRSASGSAAWPGRSGAGGPGLAAGAGG